jgi:hypothetical protein
MAKLCDFQNCNKHASYGLKRDFPTRCKLHKESMKYTSRMCICGKCEKACYNEPNKTIAICCSSCKTSTMIDIIHNTCKCGSDKRNIYNEPTEKIGICCSSCKTDTMINVKNKKCKCGKIPHFNEINEKIAICCASCKTETMINIKERKCQCGSEKRPDFNEPTESIGLYCSSCKSTTMINVICKKCKCGKARPSFNEPTETTAICCLKCKSATMVDIKSKKCKCGKAQPIFNEPTETTAICCLKCKTDTMIDVKNKKCKCGKIPVYNEPSETIGICCVSCKKETMVNVKTKMCDCGKQPNFNEPNETMGICCASCKTETMVDVRHKTCLGETNSGICPYGTGGNPKYKDYCAECFRRNFPLDPITFQIRCKTKEIAVRDFINANFAGFQHDKHLETGHCDCTIRRRIDHRKLIGNTLLVIETDENQHKSYDKMDEETRYDDLFMAYSGKWIYIRFNPDKYINKEGKRKNPMIATRLETLQKEIEKQIKRIESEENTELIERIYLYYDGYE